MNVRELIERLGKCDPEAVVFTVDDAGRYDTADEIRVRWLANGDVWSTRERAEAASETARLRYGETSGVENCVVIL